jgi:hypothetical protein
MGKAPTVKRRHKGGDYALSAEEMKLTFGSAEVIGSAAARRGNAKSVYHARNTPPALPDQGVWFCDDTGGADTD